MKTTKELLSQIKETILNGGEEQADELLREFLSLCLDKHSDNIISNFIGEDCVHDWVKVTIKNTETKID